MDITTLEYFKIIAESGSLTKAAQQLHITQPAMSAMLKKLEEELGVELFDRSPNRIYLNKTGEIALIHVNTILRNVEQLKADVLSAARQSQILSIAFCDPGVRWFSVPRFSVAHPKIQVKDDLYEGEDAAGLLSERVYDLMVTPQKIQDPASKACPFCPIRCISPSRRTAIWRGEAAFPSGKSLRRRCSIRKSAGISFRRWKKSSRRIIFPSRW